MKIQEKAKELREAGLTFREIGEEIGVCQKTAHNYVMDNFQYGEGSKSHELIVERIKKASEMLRNKVPIFKVIKEVKISYHTLKKYGLIK